MDNNVLCPSDTTTLLEIFPTIWLPAGFSDKKKESPGFSSVKSKASDATKKSDLP